MIRRILDLTAAVFIFELLLEFSTAGYCQAPESEQAKMPDFGSSLGQLQKKSNKKHQKPVVTLDSPKNNDDDVVRVTTALVVNEIGVYDKNGDTVHGLTKNDFTISEDSVPQTLEVFATSAESAIPRSVVLIIDYSESELPYIQTSVDAAKVLVDKLKPNDRMALVTDDVGLLTDFTSNKLLLKQKLDSLKEKALTGTSGKSKQYSALWATLKELFPEGTLRPIILFQTDGDQVIDFTGYGFNGNETSGSVTDSSNFKRLLSALEETGAAVYTIAPGPSFLVKSHSELIRNAESDLQQSIRSHAIYRNSQIDVGKVKLMPMAVSQWADARKRDSRAMEHLSRFSGGDMESLSAPEDADGVYSRIFSKMNERYVIGYYPTNQERDGTRRKISIRVRNHPEYKVLGRKIYIAP